MVFCFDICTSFPIEKVFSHSFLSSVMSRVFSCIIFIAAPVSTNSRYFPVLLFARIDLSHPLTADILLIPGTLIAFVFLPGSSILSLSPLLVLFLLAVGVFLYFNQPENPVYNIRWPDVLFCHTCYCSFLFYLVTADFHWVFCY